MFSNIIILVHFFFAHEILLVAKSDHRPLALGNCEAKYVYRRTTREMMVKKVI